MLRSPKNVVHNISINVTDTDSPAGVRRRIHLRSLSDVTPAGRAVSPRTRARAFSERPHHSSPPASPSAGHLSPHREISTLTSILAKCETSASVRNVRKVHSERSSPNLSLVSVECARSDTETAKHSPRPRNANRFRSDTVTILGDPWRKMSEFDLKTDCRRSRTPTHPPLDRADSDDPWVKSCTLQLPSARSTPRDNDDGVVKKPSGSNSDIKQEIVSFKRGKLERNSPVVCDSCGNESCECWRPRSPCCPGRGGVRAPRTPRLNELRQQRAFSSPGAGAAAPAPSSNREAACTCDAPSPRLSPAPRAVYKSASQRLLCVERPCEPLATTTADPLLETTC
ncbi:hypothetical protein EVAR_32725_1 [Eumeta japonica]|uniref:Uncharacterized protein n=1 Tax=Eumeta variegata TaxID=151549 RepID=A0A4C1Z8B6_EUMVA|nr:hypothetical protein EVAR_32725_1 [Eumeta japonica]